MRIMAMRIVGLFLASFLALGLWPENAYFGSPSKVMAQEASPPTEPSAEATVEKAKTQEKAKTKPAVAKEAVSPPKQTVSPPSGAMLREREIRESLETIVSLQYEEVLFRDVKKDLEDRLDVNIVLDESAIDDALTEEELVTINLKEIKLSNALRLMLRDFNATYVVRDEIVRIISFHNVSDPHNFAQRMVSVHSVLRTIGRYDSRTSDVKSATSPESLLVKTITSVVHPDAWATSDLGKAAIEIIGGVLVMRGPEGLMDETTDFLKDLEAELSAQDK